MKNILSIAFLFLLAACAQIKTPTGGVKDVEGPKILSSFPSHLETNYHAKSVVLSFDELVNLEDPKNNIIITPPLANKPEIYLKGGTELVIAFDGDLQDNTTYTINLGEAISDYNESNPLEQKLLVFSTGDIIDSLSVKGAVKVNRTDKPCDGCKVMLYLEADDSIVFKEKPYYFTKTNAQGKFQLDYLKAGDYKVVALLDENNDYYFDPTTEYIGFDAERIMAEPDTINEVALRIFKQKPEAQSLLGFQLKNDQQLELAFALPVMAPELKRDSILLAPDRYVVQLNEARDTMQVFLKDQPKKNTEWKMMVTDQGEDMDAFSVFFDGDEVPLLLLDPKPNSIKKYNVKDSIVLSWSFPIEDIDTTKISIRRDSTFLSYDMVREDAFSYQLKFKKEEGINYYLTLDSAAFMDIHKQVNDSLGCAFLMQEQDQFGHLKVTIPPTDMKQIAYLKNEKNKVVRQQILNGDDLLVFEDLPPGIYHLLLLLDTNANGQYDTGNYLKNIQPERFVRYNEAITIRANWELELEWEDGGE